MMRKILLILIFSFCLLMNSAFAALDSAPYKKLTDTELINGHSVFTILGHKDDAQMVMDIFYERHANVKDDSNFRGIIDNILVENYREALKNAEAFSLMHKDLVDGYFWQGWLYRQLKMDAQALVAFEKAREIDPENWETLKNLFFLYFGAGDKIKAYAAGKNAIACFENNPKVASQLSSTNVIPMYVSIGLISRIVGDRGYALYCFEKVANDYYVGVDDKDLRNFVALGMLYSGEEYLHKGDLNKASLYCEKGLKYGEKKADFKELKNKIKQSRK